MPHIVQRDLVYNIPCTLQGCRDNAVSWVAARQHEAILLHHAHVCCPAQRSYNVQLGFVMRSNIVARICSSQGTPEGFWFTTDIETCRKVSPAALSVADNSLLPWSHIRYGHKFDGSSRLVSSECSVGGCGMIADVKEGNKSKAVLGHLEGSAADTGKTPLHVGC